MGEVPSVVSGSVSRSLGREAQRNTILAAKVVADIVRTTLGPKGMDKLLVDSSGNLTVTNDGATILQELALDHPAAKLLVEVAQTQEREVGDGTTSVVVLAGALLERAGLLLDQRVHPTVIIAGYRKALTQSLQQLPLLGRDVHSSAILKQLAMTAMTGKGAEGMREELADLLVRAVETVGTTQLDRSLVSFVCFSGSSVGGSSLLSGVVIDKGKVHQGMPSSVSEAKVLLLDIPLEFKSPETQTSLSLTSPEQLERFVASETDYIRSLVDRIVASGATVVFCQKGIDDVAQYYLAKAGIFACRRVSKSSMEHLSKATGGAIVSSIDDIPQAVFGYAGLVEEVVHSGEQYVVVTKCKNPQIVTIVVRGGTEHIVAETERALQDGLGDIVAAVSQGKIVAGGGAVEVALARHLRGYARSLSGRGQMAVEQFAYALEVIPEALAENAGLDPLDVLGELKRRHEHGSVSEGLNLLSGNIEDCFSAGVIEPMRVKEQALRSATEVATMLLRIDDVLGGAPKPQQKEVLE